MRRLIKKSSLPTNLDLSGDSISIVIDQPLNEDFAYKLEQAYLFVETVKDVQDIIGDDNLSESDIQHLESCVSTFKSLDQSEFTYFSYAIELLSKFISISKEYEVMWEEYQEKSMELYQKSKNDGDIDELKSEVNELSNQLYNNSNETDKKNAANFFNSFFQTISKDAISNIYNQNGEYYAISYNESIALTNDLNEFVNYCGDHVTNTPEETQMPRSTYIKDYLLKDILQDQYDSYMTALNDYLNSSSDESKLQLASITTSNQDLLELNRIVSNGVNEVYRGLYFDSVHDEDYQEILNNWIVDTNGDYQYASTTTTKSTAKNFASNKEAGLLLTIQPGTIIYNSDLAGGVFGEGELIIDMNNSTITNIEEI